VAGLGSLVDYELDVRSLRVGREVLADKDCIPVQATQVASYRARATGLSQRLAAGSHAQAARAGLQDSAPRSALLGLHARMEGTDPAAWEHPSLAQIWFRSADYVVPREDLAAFTLGAAPTADDHWAGLGELATHAEEILDGRAQSPKEVAAGLLDLVGEGASRALRLLSVTGRIHIRWDARSIVMFAAEPAPVGRAEARLSLAGRFLTSYGPANAVQFGRWAGLTRNDAKATWSALAPELVPVSLEGRKRWILASEEEALVEPTEPLEGARLLPMGDPFLQLDRGLVADDQPEQLGAQLEEAGTPRKIVNGLGGRVLLGEKLVGSWGRSGRRLTIAPWTSLTSSDRRLVEEEIDRMELPLGRPAHHYLAGPRVSLHGGRRADRPATNSAHLLAGSGPASSVEPWNWSTPISDLSVDARPA
jgi:hypothetical protein